MPSAMRERRAGLGSTDAARAEANAGKPGRHGLGHGADGVGSVDLGIERLKLAGATLLIEENY